ncbi:MAG: hypothetical protein ACD_79C01389G0001 [uncultured bacterium]|nr:MAG: hypothetical protein ACD_79C01389G0001 [uncultured bacterium]
MSEHLKKEIQKLTKMILSISAMVEENVYNALEAVDKGSVELAQKVLKTDNEVDETEINIEEECLKILALHQPIAADLRFIISMIKINQTLERISDLARNIAERAIILSQSQKVNIPFNFASMVGTTIWMLNNSLNAFIKHDIELAKNICAKDDEVDKINREMYDKIKQGIIEHPEYLDQMVNLLCISRNIERIADHVVNIIEDIVYMIEGKIIRHNIKKYINEN